MQEGIIIELLGSRIVASKVFVTLKAQTVPLLLTTYSLCRHAERKCIFFRSNETGVPLSWLFLESLFPQKPKHYKNRWSQHLN